MEEKIKLEIDERLFNNTNQNSEHQYISENVLKLRKPTYSVMLGIYKNDARRTQYIGTYSSLSEAMEARDYALEQVEASPDLSMTKVGDC